MGFILLLLAHQNNRARYGRDRDAFAALLNALAATSEFAEVRLQSSLNFPPVGADRSPSAIIVPVAWQEQSDSAIGAVIRRVAYTVALIVRREDALERFETLDRLSAVVQNTLEGEKFGGFCLAPMSLVRRGRYDDASRYPELRLVLDGEFSYTIPSPKAHNTAR